MKPVSWLVIAASLALAACGGGGSGGGRASGSSGWSPGVFMPEATYAAHCVAPRSGIDPETGRSYPDVQGSRTDENNWLRSWSNDLYLWYDEIVDRDPSLYATPDYFDLMRTFAVTASGAPKDKFHFTYSTSEWYQLSQSGVSAGYGAEFTVLSATVPRKVVVAYAQPNSPATTAPANLARGAEILFVDGVDVVNANDAASLDVLNAGLFPAQANEQHTFTVRDLGAQSTRDITLVSDIVTSSPVQNVTVLPGNVGYMTFNDHLATAEQALIDAITTLKGANVGDLVLDIRYNGGGYLAIASEIAYMIAGDVATAGQTFEDFRFNDKHPITDPVTGQPLAPYGFQSTALGFSAPAGQALPTLDLPRVFVLTGEETCSASESIINSLRGIDVEVIEVGSTTCGKPYGFYATDNCGTTYFSIEFKGVNAKGFGDYTDGFSPANSIGAVGTSVPGCSVADDFAHALGDPAEGRLAAALAFRNGQACPTPSGVAAPGLSTAAATLPKSGLRLERPPWRENRILERR